MHKIIKYSMAVLGLLNTAACFAVEKFEILPDLPEALALPASASTVSGTTGASILGAQSVGHEPSIISVVFSLLFVILLIYLTGIIYTKLNKAGIIAMKKQQGDLAKSQVSVLSTTQLGSNKTLHVVELDGKRMLIGASTGTIQLIKDLGSINNEEYEEEYSHIEIPNIKIPKIEIPKIEIPTIGFSKLMTKAHKTFEQDGEVSEDIEKSANTGENVDSEENPDGIIDSLFTQQTMEPQVEEEPDKSEHIVDPDDFSLYKKYLN